MRPLVVAAVPPLGRRRRLLGIAVEPSLHVVVVELLAPEHPGDGLPQHQPLIVIRAAGPPRAVWKSSASRRRWANTSSKPAPNGSDCSGTSALRRSRTRSVAPPAIVEAMPPARFGAGASRAHRVGAPFDDSGVEGVLDERVRGWLLPEEAGGVGLVLGEEQLGCFASKWSRYVAQAVVHGADKADAPPARRRRLGPAFGRRTPRTRCSGTRAWGEGEVPLLPARGWSPVISISRSSASALAYSTSTSK